MFNFGFFGTRMTQSQTDWQIIVNGQECECVKSIAVQTSPLIKAFTTTEGNINISQFVTDIPNLPADSLKQLCTDITQIFTGTEINFEENNIEILSLIGKHFKIDDLINKIEEFQIYKENILLYLKNNSDIQEMKKLEKLLLLEMNEVNLEKTMNSCLSFSSKIPPNCFIHFISKVCLKNFKNKDLDPYLILINLIKRLERYMPGTISLFLKITFEQFFYLNRKGNSELEHREEINALVSQIFIEKMDDLVREEIKTERNEINIPTYLKEYFEVDNQSIKIKRIDKPNIKNNEENNKLQEDLALFIKKDEIDSFQQYIANQKINVNYHFQNNFKNIKTIMNIKQNCSLIECSAFFGSVKCFRFLYNSQAQINKEILGNYAIAGGNTEIIHICEQENCVFNEETLNITIKFHYHDLTKWLVETKRIPIKALHLRLSVSNYDIDSMIYLITKGIDISRILLYSCESNNIVLFKCLFLSEFFSSLCDKTLLHIACEQNNIEIVKLLLTKENVDINAIYKVYLIEVKRKFRKPIKIIQRVMK